MKSHSLFLHLDEYPCLVDLHNIIFMICNEKNYQLFSFRYLNCRESFIVDYRQLYLSNCLLSLCRYYKICHYAGIVELFEYHQI